jgi:hypothetical protein
MDGGGKGNGFIGKGSSCTLQLQGGGKDGQLKNIYFEPSLWTRSQYPRDLHVVTASLREIAVFSIFKG